MSEVEVGIEFLRHLGLVKVEGEKIDAQPLLTLAVESIPPFLIHFVSHKDKLLELGEDGILDVFLTGLIIAKYTEVEGEKAIPKDDLTAMLLAAHGCFDLTPLGKLIKKTLYNTFKLMSSRD